MITSSMTNRMVPALKVVSVLLVVLLVFCPLVEIRSYASSIEDILLVIWSAIRACGINLAGTAIGTISFLYDEIKDFAVEAGTTVTDVLYGLKYSVNSLGEFIINDTFVDFISQFVDYLTDKYNLTDNGTFQLNSSETTLNGFASYSLPIRMDNNISHVYNEWIEVQASAPAYGIFCTQTPNANPKSVFIVCWAEESAVVNYSQRNQINDASIINQNYYLVETAANGIYWASTDGAQYDYNDDRWGFSNYQIYNWSDVHAALTGLPDVEPGEDPVIAYTTIIVAPDQSSNYTIGDGAQINIGAPWGSSIYDLFDHIRTLIGSLSNQITIYYHDLASIESQVPKPSDVENLPAGTIYNINGIYQNSEGEGGIRFGGIWHYVTEWVEDFSEAAPIIWYVVTNSPDQIVNLLYATVVLTVVIGFIHKARSH